LTGLANEDKVFFRLIGQCALLKNARLRRVIIKSRLLYIVDVCWKIDSFVFVKQLFCSTWDGSPPCGRRHVEIVWPNNVV